MRTILLFLIVSLWGRNYIPLQAQLLSIEKEPIFNYGQFEIGVETRSFGENVNVRNLPNANASRIGKLSLGEVVEVLEKSDNMLTQNGYSEAWYKVKVVPIGADTYQGWVWGGLLAKTVETFDLNGDEKQEIIMAGIKSFGGKYMGPLMELKVMDGENNGLLNTTTHEAFVNGFLPVTHILRLSYKYGACDVENGSQLFFWDGKSFKTRIDLGWRIR